MKKSRVRSVSYYCSMCKKTTDHKIVPVGYHYEDFKCRDCGNRRRFKVK